MPNSLEMIDEAWERFRREPERLETYLVELLDKIERERGAVSPDFVTVSNELGSFYRTHAMYKKGEEAFLRALSSIERLVGRGDYYAICMGNLGELYRLWGRPEDAGRCLDIAETCFEDKGSAEFAACLNYHGHLCSTMGRLEDARRHYRHALELVSAIEGHEYEVEAALGNLASACEALGDYEEAYGLLLRAKAFYDDGSLAPRAHYVSLLNSIALVLERLGRDGEAREVYLEEIDAMRTTPVSPVDAAVSFANAGDFFHRTGDTSRLAQIKDELGHIAATPGIGDNHIVLRSLERARAWE